VFRGRVQGNGLPSMIRNGSCGFNALHQRISAQTGPDGSRPNGLMPNRKRSYGPLANRARRDRYERLPLCFALFAGPDRTVFGAERERFAPPSIKPIRPAMRHEQEVGLPASTCRRAGARSSLWRPKECWWMPSTRKKHGL